MFSKYLLTELMYTVLIFSFPFAFGSYCCSLNISFHYWWPGFKVLTVRMGRSKKVKSICPKHGGAE